MAALGQRALLEGSVSSRVGCGGLLSLSPARFPLPGAWRLSGGYLAIIPIYQHTVEQEAGSPCGLTAGHMDQANSQWAAGEVAAMTSFRSTGPIASRNQTCPRLPALHLSVFSAPGQEDRACQNQCGARNIIMTAAETVTITEPKGKGRPSGATGRGDPLHLSYGPSQQEVTGTPLFLP